MTTESQVIWQVWTRIKGSEDWEPTSTHSNGPAAVLAMNQVKAYYAERVPFPVEVRAVRVEQIVQVLASVVS